MKKFLFLITGAVFMLGSSIFAGNGSSYSWHQFHLNLDKVSLSITHDGTPLEAQQALSSISKSDSIKTEALAMAFGYSVFLQLTDLPLKLKNEGKADNELVNKIMSGVSLNYTLAMGFQETRYIEAAHSGFFQIDNQPFAILKNAYGWYGKDLQQEYYNFLYYLNGGATYGPGEYFDPDKKTMPKEAVVCQGDQKGFVWAAVEKGYYDAISYNMNKTAYSNVDPKVPYPEFNMAKWAVEYSKDHKDTRTPFQNGDLENVKTIVEGQIRTNNYQQPEQQYKIEPYYCIGIALSYLYNRGQNPFSYKITKNEQSKLFTNVFETHVAFEEIFKDYPDLLDSKDAVAWGKRYIWQIPWLFSMLNDGSQVYNENISKEDVIAMLNILKGFYNGEKADTDKAVEAAIAKASELQWGYSFDSSETFNNIEDVTEAMLAKSKDIKFTGEMKTFVQNSDPNFINVKELNTIDWSKPGFYDK